MRQSDPSGETTHVEGAETSIDEGGELADDVTDRIRTSVDTGILPAIVGGLGLLGGFRAFRRGHRKRGFLGVLLGVALLAGALLRRRSRHDAGGDPGLDIETADEGETTEPMAHSAPDLGAAESSSDTRSGASSVEEGQVADTAVEREDIDEESGLDPDELVAEDIDRLGEAAFDAQSQEVPVPQRAFNLELLSHGSEAFWGVRASDGAVLVSQNYGALEEREGVEYIASSEIGADVRELPIPSAVRNHWDDEIGGSIALAGEDDILFATTESLAEDGLLWVLPAAWEDERFPG